jgi:hypothetical protein
MRLPRIYTALLRLYPRDYRLWFADEMHDAFADGLAERRARGRAAVFLFAGVEIGSVLSGALSEWIAKRRSDRAIRGRCLPDAGTMRPPGVSKADHYRWR